MTASWARAKAWLIGSPIASAEHEHQLLPKVLALPVFASDPLSSVAYATEEIALVLAVAGSGALSQILPISVAIAALMAIVVVSYRQTVRAYPDGGGAFIVAHDNLGLCYEALGRFEDLGRAPRLPVRVAHGASLRGRRVHAVAAGDLAQSLLTLGLFTLVINALMLMLSSWIAGQLNVDFRVENFWWAFLGALLISVVSFVLSKFLGSDRERRR